METFVVCMKILSSRRYLKESRKNKEKSKGRREDKKRGLI
jgi:hypothetical protein